MKTKFIHRYIVCLLAFDIFVGVSASAYAQSTIPTALIHQDRAGVGLSGYDVVAYFMTKKATKGLAVNQAVHNAVTYHFGSAENLAAFRKAPETFLPQFGGFCTPMLAMANKPELMLAPPEPDSFWIVDQRLYMGCEPFSTMFQLKVPQMISDARWNWRNKLKQP